MKLRNLCIIFVLLVFNSCKKDGWVRVENLAPTDITLTSVTCGGYVYVGRGEEEIYSRGIVYGLVPFPTIDDQFIESTTPLGEGAFKCDITGLLPDTIYYMRPYVQSSDGIAYSFEDMEFRTEYIVGNHGPAGGFIFYLDGLGGGLEVSPIDVSANSKWGCYGTNIPGALQEGLYTGAANTAAIVADCGEADCAARLCDDFVYNGFDDWYLPSKDELLRIAVYIYMQGKGDFVGASMYWSSTGVDAFEAWEITLHDGWQYTYYKTQSTNNVRAVRTF